MVRLTTWLVVGADHLAGGGADHLAGGEADHLAGGWG